MAAALMMQQKRLVTGGLVMFVLAALVVAVLVSYSCRAAISCENARVLQKFQHVAHSDTVFMYTTQVFFFVI